MATEMAHRVRGCNGCVAALLVFLAIASLPARAQSDAERAKDEARMDSKVVAWAKVTLPKYRQYIEYARHGPRPQVPVPPEVDPPCHLCGDNTPTEGEQEVDAWFRQSSEPEATYLKGLLEIGHNLALLRAADYQLSQPAEQALLQFESINDLMEDAAKLADRLVVGKAIPMAEKYHTDPQRAYAGIKFVLAAAKTAMLVDNGPGGNPGTPQVVRENYEDEIIPYVKSWVQAVVSDIDQDVLTGHKYNLCPVYADIYRSLGLLGGPDDVTASYIQVFQKMQQLMTFNVNMELQVAIHTGDGGHLNATWTGKARLKLMVDATNSCYTPHWEDSSQMAVNVTQWDMVIPKHLSNGSVQLIPAALSSPHQYNVNLDKAQLNLCGPQPIFQIPLAHLKVPQEKLTADGHTADTVLFGPFLGAVVGANEFNNPATNAMTGQTPSLPGAVSPTASSGSGSSGDSSSTEALDQAKAQIEAHKGDVSWLMSAEGQAVVARMQKLALAHAQSQMADAGLVIPRADTFIQLSDTVNSAHLHWTNGRVEPVNQTLQMHENGNSWVLDVTVQQAPQ